MKRSILPSVMSAIAIFVICVVLGGIYVFLRRTSGDFMVDAFVFALCAGFAYMLVCMFDFAQRLKTIIDVYSMMNRYGRDKR